VTVLTANALGEAPVVGMVAMTFWPVAQVANSNHAPNK
jgi:hypothetical protein